MPNLFGIVEERPSTLVETSHANRYRSGVVSPPDAASLIAERLRIARARSRLSVADVSRALGRSRDTLTNWEAGKTAPTAVDLLAIVTLYRCSADWILGRDALTGFCALLDPRLEARLLGAPNLKTWRAGIAALACQLRDDTETVTDGDAFFARVRAVHARAEELRDTEENGNGPKRR